MQTYDYICNGIGKTWVMLLNKELKFTQESKYPL